MSGKLYVVATPIGNLSDITLRAIEILSSVDVVACEDTRQTAKLMNHLKIKKTLISFHQHSKESKVEKVIDLLNDGKNVALVTDAGTPGVSDPGGVLVSAAYENDIPVESVPGASAVAAAISISGINLQEFVFAGFLPHKKGRQTKLKELSSQKLPVIFYESPYRIKKLLAELLEFFGDSPVVIAREISKLHETVYRGRISEVEAKITEKGEFVVIIEKHDK